MPSNSRRAFLSAFGTGFSGAALLRGAESRNVAGPSGSRIEQCYCLRSTAAAYKISQGEPPHPANEDERLYPRGAASYSKGLPHDSVGEPIPASYAKLVAALSEGTFTALEAVPLGGNLKLSNPLAENAFDLEGLDSRQFSIPVPPACASAKQAYETIELYWQALTRDVPFSRWENDATIAAAMSDLGASGFISSSSPHARITLQNLFRIPGRGVLEGPYVSQFLLLPVPNGNMLMDQRYLSAVPGQSFATIYPEWLALQNGAIPSTEAKFENSPRYLSTPRGLIEYVHRDYTFQAFLCASLILSSFGQDALNDTNPYKWSKTQAGFVTFGAPHIIDCMARAANAALKAAWFQKWLVHRRIRPEEYAARVHNTITGAAKYPVHGDLLKSSSLNVLHFANGTYLLPQAYPEGCPAHPAYPAGHAAIAGACATMLKAFFRDDFVIPKPMVSDPNGNALIPYSGVLTVGGELTNWPRTLRWHGTSLACIGVPIAWKGFASARLLRLAF